MTLEISSQDRIVILQTSVRFWQMKIIQKLAEKKYFSRSGQKMVYLTVIAKKNYYQAESVRKRQFCKILVRAKKIVPVEHHSN